MTTTPALLLARRPSGPITHDCFSVGEAVLPVVAEGQVRLRLDWLSVDPAMRGWVNEAPSYIAPVALGAPMRAYAVGTVVESRSADLHVGSLVTGLLAAQHEIVVAAHEVRPVPDPGHPGAALGVLGVTGLTAYFGLYEIGCPRPGDTVAVTGAAGAVGSVAVQLAVIAGARVIGVAGGPEKCAAVRRLGAVACLDYKAKGWARPLAELAPDGIDVLFDNVGGPVLDRLLWSIAERARVVLCGAISQYDAAQATGPAGYLALIVKRASMTGFLLQDFTASFGIAEARLARWRREGALIGDETHFEGLAKIPEAIIALFSGATTGKTLVKLNVDERI